MLAIIAAFKEEVKDYLKRGGFRAAAREGSVIFYRSSSIPEVVVAEGGIGRRSAEEATTFLIESYKPDFIVCVGFAAGARVGLKPGDLFLCDRLLAIEGPAPLWRADAAMERSLADVTFVDDMFNQKQGTHQVYVNGGCLSVPELVSGSSMKAWIGWTFPVNIIDMESYWVSETAAQHGIPHVVVRSVLDPVEQTLPAFVGKSMGDGGGLRWRRAVKYFVMKPREAPTLVHLAAQVKVASSSIGRFLVTLESEKQ